MIQNLSSGCAVVKVSGERKASAVSRFLVSLELARMTRSFDLGVVTVTVILNSEERV
ncbi:hypothetical protein HLBS07_02370 [Vibrio alginolyticus]|nr:hypothetical protein HLBS07_02370 [Vibrio alginolyticus]